MRTRIHLSVVLVVIFVGLMSFTGRVHAQTYENFPVGSYIINMGVTPQTVGNGLKPYGMIYDLIFNHGVPIKWIVDPSKLKDGIDFSHGGIDYRGGPFIVPANFRTTAVNDRITYWQGQGVVGATTSSPLSLPVFKTLTVSSAPKWTLDKQSGSIALGYFTNAGIPESAYGGNNSNLWKNPNDLDCCDDIFVMPHADPKWATHGWLMTWNLDCKGSIWLACHSGSALENMYNPANTSEQTNFLSEKVTTPGAGIILPVPGSTAYSQNSLILWGNHKNGTPPYTYSNPQDPIMQFMGIIDGAVLNGSEQIYIPVNGNGSGWRPTTVVAVYDPDNLERAGLSDLEKDRAAIIAYGRGYGDPERGYVMMEAGHSHNKALLPANIAAQRAFFNFSFLAAKVKAPDPEIDINITTLYSGATTTLSFDISPSRDISEFTTIEWTSSCPGASFSPGNTQTTNFTAPIVSANTNCVITVRLVDNCGRTYRSSVAAIIICDLQVTTTLTNPCYDQPNGGSIAMSFTNGTPPYAWTWSRTSPPDGPVSNSGTTIPNLEAGTYSVTVTDNGGSGCPAYFTVPLTLSPEIIINATAVHLSCPGGSNGGINVSVSGGIPGYTYLWGDGPTTANRSGLTAGTYNLTVTDSKGCIGTASVAVNQPDPIVITPSPTDVSCYGFNNGEISLGVTGGTGSYTYLWSDGSNSPNRTGLAPDSYSVTVTDANSCTQVYSNIEVTQPAAALSLGETHVNVLCYGNSTGSIDLSVSGGTPLQGGPPHYTYLWAGPGGPYTTEDLGGLAAGIYAVTVTDARSCIATLSVTITQLPALTLSVQKTDPTCPPDADQNFADGSITLIVSGGTGIGTYTFDWADLGNPGEFTDPQNRSGLMAGTYTVTVKDANNCTATASVTLVYLNPNPPQPSSIDH